MPIWPQTNAYFQEPNSEKTNNGIHYKLQLLYSNGKCKFLYSAGIDLQVFYSLNGAVLTYIQFTKKCSSVYSTNVILVDGKSFFFISEFQEYFLFFFFFPRERCIVFYTRLFPHWKTKNNFPQASEQNRIFMFG